jgi:hypothetical protein
MLTGSQRKDAKARRRKEIGDGDSARSKFYLVCDAKNQYGLGRATRTIQK